MPVGSIRPELRALSLAFDTDERATRKMVNI